MRYALVPIAGGFVALLSGCPSPQIGPVACCSVSRPWLMSQHLSGDATPRCLAFAPDGKTVAIGTGPGEKGSVILRDVADGNTIKKLTTDFEVRQLAYSPDGKELFLQGDYVRMNGSMAPTILPRACLLDASTGKTDERKNSELRTLVLASDKKATVCTTATPGEIKVQPTFGAAAQAATFQVSSQAIKQLALAAGGRLVAFVDDANKIRVCDLTKQQAAFVDDDNKIRVTDLEQGGDRERKSLVICQQVAKMEGHKAPIQRLQFTPDGRRLISAGGDDFQKPAEVIVWDIVRQQVQFRLPDLQGPFNRFELSADGRYLAVGTRSVSESTALTVWDLNAERGSRVSKDAWPTPVRIASFDKLAWNTPIAFSPDGRRLAVVEYSGQIRTVDVDRSE